MLEGRFDREPRYSGSLPERVRAVETSLDFMRENLEKEFRSMAQESNRLRAEQTDHFDRRISELSAAVAEIRKEIADLRQVVARRSMPDESGRRIWWAFVSVGICVGLIAVFLVLLYIRLGPT